jgi:thiosulfate/3-mercaptopyruvate sulfurtransferase
VHLGGGDPASLATLEQVKAWSAETVSGGPIRILDVRKPAEFIGEDRQSKRGGHVPGAANVDWERFVNDDYTFRSPAEIRAIVDEAVRAAGGEDATSLRATYCQGGVRAAASWFVLSVLGGLQVANYARSWEEWGNRDDTPIEV